MSVKNTLICLLSMFCAFLLMSVDLQEYKNDRNRKIQLRKTRHNLRNNLRDRMQTPKEICFDIVGCFQLPRKHLPLKSIPDHPEFLETKFYLYRRGYNDSNLDILGYTDDLNNTSFNPKNPVKMIIHGFMTQWDEPSEIQGAKTYLEIDDYNVVLVDWKKGAQGPQYSNAAANTEVVGRQAGLLLLKMVDMGTKPEDIHLIGFSLGAHIAGCASETLKKFGLLIGRITGLDPASPLFKHNLITDKSKKLDRGDASFVDIIHTDGSPVFTDGFGLLDPLGHVDFFPNGGREQPGCNDGRVSVVISHFDKSLNKEIACSHVRAWLYYLETIRTIQSKTQGCTFVSYPCPSALSFVQGSCFPIIGKTSDINSFNYGRFGENPRGSGPMYLTTRSERPFCGTQLQASIRISEKTQNTRGIFNLRLIHGNHSTNFQINCDLLDIVPVGYTVHGLAAAEYDTINPDDTRMILAHLSYHNLAYQSMQNDTTDDSVLFLNAMSVRDMFGNQWEYKNADTKVEQVKGEHYQILSVEMKLVGS